MSWKEISIGEIGQVITGNTPPRKNPEFYGNAYKFIKPTDMDIGNRYTPVTEDFYSEIAYEKYIKSLIPPLSTCVVTIGSIGQKMTLTDSYSFINQAVNAVIPNTEKFDQIFIFYALKNNPFYYVEDKELNRPTLEYKDCDFVTEERVRITYTRSEQVETYLDDDFTPDYLEELRQHDEVSPWDWDITDEDHRDGDVIEDWFDVN